MSKIRPALPRLGLIFGGLLILGGAVGLLGIQLLSKNESFDLRKSASTGEGSAKVTISKTSPNKVTVGQKVTLKGTINTNGIQTNGVQVVLSLTGPVKPEQVTAQVTGDSGLTEAYSKVTPGANQTQIAVIALPPQIGQPFANNSDQQFLEITFVAKKSGTVTVTSDSSRSKITVYQANPPQNILSHVVPLKITVNDSGDDPHPTATPTPTKKSPHPTATPTPNKKSPHPTATPTPTKKPPNSTATKCNLSPPTNLTSSWKNKGQIAITWDDSNRNKIGFELFLIEEGTPPTGGRIIQLIDGNIPNHSHEYLWTIPKDQQHRPYYRFMLRVVASDSCQRQIRSQALYPHYGGSDSLELGFKLQGVNRSGIHTDAMVTLKNLSKPAADSVSFFGHFSSNDQGIFTSVRPIFLDNLRIGPNNKYQISVKTQNSLNKILGEMTFKSGQNRTPKSWDSKLLLVGDFVHDDSSFNVIDISDIGLMFAHYTSLIVPAHDELAQFDVNYDGEFKLQDVSLVLSNYNQLAVKGDEL